jgi:hypothetical protein
MIAEEPIPNSTKATRTARITLGIANSSTIQELFARLPEWGKQKSVLSARS